MTVLTGLRTNNFSEYFTELIKLRNEVFAGEKIELSESDFTWTLRIYFHWHMNLKKGAFEDFHNLATATLKIYDKYAAKLKDLEEGTVNFLLQYTENKAFDPSKFDYVDSSVEIAAHICLEEFHDILKKATAAPNEELKTIADIAAMMRKMASCVGVCETLLSKVADQQIDSLYDIFTTFAPIYQKSVLMAFNNNDHYKGNEKIIAFHQKYLDSNPEFWLELATENMEQLKG